MWPDVLFIFLNVYLKQKHVGKMDIKRVKKLN